MKKCAGIVLFVLCLGAWSVQAAVLASWDATGLSAAAASTGTQPPATVGTGVTVSSIQAGAGLVANGGNHAASAFGVGGYDQTSASAALAGGDYWQLSITPNAGRSVSLSSIEFKFRSSNSGPKDGQWAYSSNGTSFTWLDPAFTYPGTGWPTSPASVSVSAIAALQNVSDTIYLRFVAWNGGSVATAWGSFGKGADVIVVNGTVGTSGPAVPTISFDPSGSQTVIASNLLSVTATVLNGTFKGFSVTPTPSGTASASGTTWSFRPIAADVGQTFTLSATATNTVGTATQTMSIAVTAYVPQPPAEAYVIDFEDATKGGYASSDLSLNGKTWNLTGILIGTDTLDKKFGNKSARADMGRDVVTMTSQFKFTDGISTISLYYAAYSDRGTNAPVMAIEMSETLSDDDDDWTQVAVFDIGTAPDELVYDEFDVYVATPAYLRFRGIAHSERGNLDNITFMPYTAPVLDAYDAFLLRYNVTPGDPGTAQGDDLDGDGYTNLQEFNANPQTNPYDSTSHP